MTIRPSTCPACGTELELADATTAGLPDDDGPACAACGHGQWFRVEAAGDVCVVHLQGRGIVTEQNVMRVLERVRSLIGDRGCDRVLIDFQGVNYLSSTILGRLINLARMAHASDARLKLCNIQPDVQDVFRLTRLESFFAMHRSQAEAIEAF